MDSCWRRGSRGGGPPPAGGGLWRGLGARRVSSDSSNMPFAARIRCRYVLVVAGGGSVFSSIILATQSSSTDVLLQLLDKRGVATHGMPARRILSNAFSSTFRHATPTIASTWPDTMIFRTIGVPSETRTLYPSSSARTLKSATEQAPHFLQSRPNSS